MADKSTSTTSFFTKQKLLPQSQTPDQLAAWLSTTHPGYDLVAWCFYGHLISEGEGGGEHDKIAAVSTITQFKQGPSLPQLEGIGIRPFQSAFTYDDAKTDGYIGSGDESLSPIPAVTNTQNPWSLVVSYELQGKQSTICLSLLSGRMGSMCATYMMTADVWCNINLNGQRLRAEIEFVDSMGVVNEGYGPSGFAPQGITPQQAREIKEKYNFSVPDYLDKTEDPMTNQGAYSYSAPLLKVQRFKIIGDDDKVLNEGSAGYLWMDYMVMSYPTPSQPNTGSDATWQFFAIQFPTNQAALMVCIVESSQTKLPTAKFFSKNSCPMTNGALNAEHEWRMDEIILIPDPNSVWVSPHGTRYHMQYTIELNSPEFVVVLFLKSIRKKQEIYIPASHKGQKPVTKYEGVFEVSGTIKGETCHGYAWGELKKIE